MGREDWEFYKNQNKQKLLTSSIMVLKLTKIYKQNIISHIKIIDLKFIWLNELL